MMKIETTLDDDVYGQVVALAAQHTGGNIPAMLSIMIRREALGQEYDYAVMRENRLNAILQKKRKRKGEQVHNKG